MKSKPIQVLQIDIDKKNLLVIHIPEEKAREERGFIEDLPKALQEWIENDDQPIYILAVYDDIEVRLEKLEGEPSEERQLLEEIWEEISDGGFLAGEGGNTFCFFCGGKPLNHSPDCLYIKLWEYMSE
jgi:hypothetical protein